MYITPVWPEGKPFVVAVSQFVSHLLWNNCRSLTSTRAFHTYEYCTSVPRVLQIDSAVSYGIPWYQLVLNATESYM